MGDSNTFKVLSRAITYATPKLSKRQKNNNRKKKTIKYNTRTKANAYTYKQHGIFLELQKELPMVHIWEDFKKAKQWWDFAFPAIKVAVKIVGPNTKYNSEYLERLGWRIFTLNYTDNDKKSFNALVKDIKFVLSKSDWLKDRAKDLNDHLPKSEEWLMSKIQKEFFYRKCNFRQNVPMFGRYIYDLFSEKYRICIEVDGSVHNTEEQQTKDYRKNQETITKGFHIIRIKAFDDASYDSAILLIKQVIANYKSKTFRSEKQKEINDTIIRLEQTGKLPF